MSKILLYLAILFTLLTAGLGYWNYTCYQVVLLEKRATIQQQQEEIEHTTQELHALKEKIDAEAATEQEHQKALLESQQVRTKAEADLAEAQKQLANKEEELAQCTKDLLTKEATIQSLMATQKSESPAATSPVTTKKKTSKSSASEKKEVLSETPAPSLPVSLSPAAGREGRVAAVNLAWHFVVLNIGENSGIVKDTPMLIRRGDQTVAKIKISSVEPLTSIGDIIPTSLASGSSIQVGDQVVPIDASKS
jgi:chemotaxis protein histidine kinase CheA